MIVCICHRVSDRDIARAVRQGCATYDELQEHLLVGSACGACGDCARDTFDAQRQQQCAAATATATATVSWFGRSAALGSAPQPAGMG